jgi:RNA polymerase primary sigma factor
MSQTDSDTSRPQTMSPELAQLMLQGRQRGFVTFEDIQATIPNSDDAVDLFDAMYAALTEAGIPVRDASDEATAEEESTATSTGLLDEGMSDALLSDSVRMYLREIGQVPLLTTEQERRLATRINDGQEALKELETIDEELAAIIADAPDAPNTLVRISASRSAEQEKAMNLALDKLPADRRKVVLELIRRISDGREARQQMAAANLRLVVSIAKRYRDRGLPLLDLIQEGSLGLLRAIEKFDYRKGFKFSTYATWWIKQALSRALADQSRLVRLPVHLGETLNRVQAARRQLTQVLGRDPLDSELAQSLGMTEEKLRELRRTAQDPVSLATPVGEEADSTLADFIPDPHALDADDAAASGMLRVQIGQALDQLTERERRVLELRYGLSDGQPRTLEEVGRAFGVTRERVRQIEVKALRKLRHPRLGKLLKDYLDQI